jgi:hypothetical protein
MKHIYLIGGSKGGVGKSFVAMAAIDYLRAHNERVVLVECDTSNPDVYKTYKDMVHTHLINMDEADGWVELVNVCNETDAENIVINTAARNNISTQTYGTILSESLSELNRKLITIWVINRQRDSLELLKDYMEAIPNTTEIHVVRNGYFGAEAKFELYNSSRLRQTIEARGGKSLTFPELADRVADDIYTKRIAIEKALQELPLGNRAELMRWRREAHRALGEIIYVSEKCV